MKHFLVTGGAGFIGSNLCLKLLEKGHFVLALDNFVTSSGKNIKKLQKNPNFRFMRHDIINPVPAELNSKNLKIDTICHLACPTGVPNIKILSLEMLLTCSIGTRNVLELARKKQAQVIFTSSSEVYGDPKVFPQRENYTGNVDPTGARSPYEEGKRFA